MSRGTLAAILSRGAAILASFALTVVVARVVGVDRAGVFFLVAAVITVLSTVGRLGSETMVVKLTGGTRDMSASRSTIARLGLLTLVASSIVAMGSVVVVGVSSWFGDSVSQPALVFAFSAIVAQSLYVFAGAALRGSGRIAAGVIAELGSAPMAAVVILITMSLWRTVTIDDALVVFAATSWLTAGWATAMVGWLARPQSARDRSTHREDPLRFTPATWRSLASMMGVSVVYFASVWSPIFILGAIGSLESVALYTAAVRLVNVIGLIPSIQASYLSPRFAGLIRAGELHAVSALAGRSALIATGLALVPGLVLALGSSAVVLFVYGVDYRDAAPLLVILTLGAVIVVAIGQVNQLALLSGVEHSAFLAACIAALAWGTIGVAAIATLGALGAAVTAIAVNVSYASALCVLLRRRSISSWASLRR